MEKILCTLAFFWMLLILGGLYSAAYGAAVIAPPKEDLIVSGEANAFVKLDMDIFYKKDGIVIGLCDKPLFRDPVNCKTFEQLASEYGMTLVIPAFNIKENKILLYGHKSNLE